MVPRANLRQSWAAPWPGQGNCMSADSHGKTT
jgi:hypothetical protein